MTQHYIHINNWSKLKENEHINILFIMQNLTELIRKD